MKETATVKEVVGDHVVLEKMRVDACSRCSARANCTLLSTGKAVQIKASRQGIEVEPGDLVEIEVTDMSATRVAFIVYGIPLLVFVTVLVGAILAGFGELVAMLLSFASVIVAFIGVALYDRRNREKLTPVLIRRLGKANELPNNE